MKLLFLILTLTLNNLATAIPLASPTRTPNPLLN